MATGTEPQRDFQHAADSEPQGFLSDYWAFLKQSKKWWLLPLLAIMLLFGLLLLFSGSAAAPFIYTLF